MRSSNPSAPLAARSSIAPTPSRAIPSELSGEAKQAIEKIAACQENADTEILDISQDATKADVLAAWRRLEYLVQPYIKDKAVGQTFCSNTASPCNEAGGWTGVTGPVGVVVVGVVP